MQNSTQISSIHVWNHRNRVAFVSCVRESALWAELSSAGVNDWATHMFSAEVGGEKKENYIIKSCDIEEKG